MSFWRVCVFSQLCWCVVLPPARAQQYEPAQREPAAEAGEELILDPELGSADTAAQGANGNAEIIDDPELTGANGARMRTSSPPPMSTSSAPQAPPSEVHLVLHARGNRDLVENDPREEMWESTTLLSIDATLRRSESLRFGLGIAARYHFASLARSVPDAHAQRYDLDAVPTSGYIDASLAPGLHVRAGYQPVALGRFDVFSATNVLSTNDLRDGPATIPGRQELGQLALMVDYDPLPWLSLRAIYVPFFMPHLISVMESDYALFPGNQKSFDAVLAGLGDLITTEELQTQLKNNLLRSARDRIATGALSAFMPQPQLRHPQGALRATAHAPFGEIAATFATALEHMPSFRLSDASIALLSDPDMSSGVEDPEPISVEYTRFALISVDASFDVAPFQLGFEAAYQVHRALYAVGTAYPEDPLSIPVLGHSDLVQGGARLEYTESTTWLFAIEAFASFAVSLPDNPERGWIAFESGRFLRGVGGMLGYASDFGLSLQIGAAWLSGPSVVFSPRLAYDLMPELTLEVGAFIIDGQTPPPFASPILSVGGVWNGLDHVFVGLRAAL